MIGMYKFRIACAVEFHQNPFQPSVINTNGSFLFAL